MSLILDALNRSESERRGSGEIPGLATEHFSEPSPDGRRLTAYLPWLGLVLAIAVIAWLLLDRSEPDLGVSELSAPSEVPGAAPAPIANQPAPVANVAEAPPPAAAAAVTEATPVKKRTVSPSPAARG
ncbi:MAG: hypothetical protein ABJK20_06650, partial [Halieaceae bacterium]